MSVETGSLKSGRNAFTCCCDRSVEPQDQCRAYPHDQPESIESGMDLQRVDDHPLYVLHYQGDYAFDEFLK